MPGIRRRCVCIYPLFNDFLYSGEILNTYFYSSSHKGFVLCWDNFMNTWNVGYRYRLKSTNKQSLTEVWCWTESSRRSCLNMAWDNERLMEETVVSVSWLFLWDYTLFALQSVIIYFLRTNTYNRFQPRKTTEQNLKKWILEVIDNYFTLNEIL